MSTWKEDREALREYARTYQDGGQKATFIYALISHMHERVHMKSYRLYHGGWRNLQRERVFAINSLSDQAEWIQDVLRYQSYCSQTARHLCWMDPKLQEIAQRVLPGCFVEEKVEVPVSSPHSSATGRAPGVMTLGSRVRVALRALFGPIV